MIGWNTALSAKEIEAVTDYILQAQASPSGVQNHPRPSTVDTKLCKLNIETVVDAGMKDPWGIEFVDANLALITGKNSDLYWMINGKIDPQKITGLPKPYGYNLYGGMMDLALDPDYAKNGWVYIGLSANPANSTDSLVAGMTKVIRGKIRNNRWVEEQTLFQVNDSLLVKVGMRWGCRLLFDTAGYLYFTIGDMQQSIQSGNNPQLPTRPEGKIYRINRDGSIPKDNPLYGKKGTLQAIYCWGTRNVQGLAQHPVTREIYFTDHGPRGGDELNLLKKGGNYGWPVVTHGVNYNGSLISSETHKEGMEQPMTYWTPSIAICAAEFVTGNQFPQWKNNLLVTALNFEEVRRLVIDGDKVIEQEVLLKGYGRVRDIKIGPDGMLYVLTNGPDTLLRITPQ
jgi:glucose/arabinose dehydrogenase